jgi:hypothetical protein
MSTEANSREPITQTPAWAVGETAPDAAAISGIGDPASEAGALEPVDNTGYPEP